MIYVATQIARNILFDIPTVLVMALPVATALASSLATSRLARDNEGMKAALKLYDRAWNTIRTAQ